MTQFLNIIFLQPLKILVLGIACLLFSVLENQAQANDFYIEEGKQLELCRDIKQILDDPENKDFAVPYLKNSDLPITKKYKDFALPKWEDVAIEDAKKYMKPSKKLSEIENFKADNPYITKINSDHYVMQKTRIDFDHDGKKDDIIRYKLEGDSVVYDHDNWSCYVADAGGDSVLSRVYNDHGRGRDCFIFFYKKRIYQNLGYGYTAFGIYQANSSTIPAQVNIFPVCTISLTEEKDKIASKAISEHFNGSDYKKRKEKIIEVRAKNQEMLNQNSSQQQQNNQNSNN